MTMNWNSPFTWFSSFIVLIYIPIFLFIFQAKRAVQLRKRLWPPLMILTGITVVGYAYFESRNLLELLILIPFIAVICFLNIRYCATFCISCGSATYNRTFWTKLTECPECGAKLN